MMKIFKNGIFLKLGYYYKSPIEELATEMFFPFKEVKIVPIFSQWATSKKDIPKIRLWQVWHKKYDFFGKLSSESGNTLFSALKNILSPEELEKIVRDYELIGGVEENGA